MKQYHCTHPGCPFAWLATTSASHVAPWVSLPENTCVFYLRRKKLPHRIFKLWSEAPGSDKNKFIKQAKSFVQLKHETQICCHASKLRQFWLLHMRNLQKEIIRRKPQTVLVCSLVKLRQIWLLHMRCFKNQ